MATPIESAAVSFSLMIQDTRSSTSPVRARAKLTVLVVRYMAYLRSLPDEGTLPDEEVEMKTAEDFIQLICTEQTWPIARQAEPEFQGPRRTVRSDVCRPLSHILSAVLPMMTPSEPKPPSDHDFEREFQNRKFRDFVRVLGYVNGRIQDTNSDQLREIEDDIGVVEGVRDVLESLEIDADFAGEGSTQSAGKTTREERPIVKKGKAGKEKKGSKKGKAVKKTQAVVDK